MPKTRTVLVVVNYFFPYRSGLTTYTNTVAQSLRKANFDVEVFCYDIKDGVGDSNCKQVSLQELQQKADVLSLHTHGKVPS